MDSVIENNCENDNKNDEVADDKEQSNEQTKSRFQKLTSKEIDDIAENSVSKKPHTNRLFGESRY